jgi:hypothetical protein
MAAKKKTTQKKSKVAQQKINPTQNKSSKARYRIRAGETAAEFTARVYATQGAELDKIDPKTKKQLDDIRGIGGLSITDFADVAQGGDLKHDPFILKNFGKKVPSGHIPRMELKPRNIIFNDKNIIQSNKPFTASEAKKFGTWFPQEDFSSNELKTFAAAKTRGIGGVFLWPKYWQNPYQYQDYLVLQDNYANTIAGRILDVIVYFTMANGIKPKLQPKDKAKFKTDEELSIAIEKAEWVTNVFEQIDASISKGGDITPFTVFDDKDNAKYIPNYSTADKDSPKYDTPLQAKWSAACTMGLNFGRTAIVPNVDPQDNAVDFQVNGKQMSFKGIPKILQIIHPRDLGFNFVDPLTWKLLGIQVYNSNWILKPNQMMFLEWNPDNPVYGSMFYGFSAMQSMIGSARSLRRIIEVDFPLIAKTRWSGMYWIFFKRKGEGLTTAQQEHAAILSSIKLDGINISLEDDPLTDVKIENIDLDPKIMELIEMCKFLIQYMMSQVGMPQGLVFGEQDLNRDTLKTGIQTFTKGPIKRYRRWILTAATQWYERMAATIIPQNPDIAQVLEDFDIVATVDEFNLESPAELAAALSMLENVTGPWKIEAKAEFLEMEDLQQKIDPDKGPEDLPPMPGMSKGPMNVENQGTGQKFKVS